MVLIRFIFRIRMRLVRFILWIRIIVKLVGIGDVLSGVSVRLEDVFVKLNIVQSRIKN